MKEKRPARKHNYNKLKTGLEAGFNFAKASAIPIALGYLGINALDIGAETAREIYNNFSEGPVPFLAGAGVGLIKNYAFFSKTLKNLDGKTTPGTMLPMKVWQDKSTVEAQISCIDIRRLDGSGGAIPGSYAVLGSELTSLLMAGMVGKLTSDANPVAQFMVGYNVGANVLSEGHAIYGLLSQISSIVKRAKVQTGNPNVRVRITMKDHWDGCGAQGYTSIASYLAKFNLHNHPKIGKFGIADLIGLPNEILGYMFVNSMAPVMAVLSGGRVSLSASVFHSKMKG